MTFNPEAMQIIITPQIRVSLEHNPAEGVQQHETSPIQSDIPLVWVQDGLDFRLDITLPSSSMLEILFPLDLESLHVNGELAWGKSMEQSDGNSLTQVEILPSGLHFKCTAGGALHILATFTAKGEPLRS
jgi:hypothetical protein